MDFASLLGGGGGSGAPKSSAASYSSIAPTYGADLAALIPVLIVASAVVGVVGVLWLILRK